MRLTRPILRVASLLLLGVLPGCKFTAVGPTLAADVATPDDDVASPDTTGDATPVDVVIDKCAPATMPDWFGKGVCAPQTGHTCNSVTGAWTFNAAGIGDSYQPVTEGMPSETLCDGLDNDCDGSTDEAIQLDPSKGDDYVATGCKKKGVCAAGARALCNALADDDDRWICDYSEVVGYEPSERSCDGLDNDCDGSADKALNPADSTCSTKGVCAALVAQYANATTPEGDKGVRCEGGAWKCEYALVPEWQQVETACDGLDNDCDGMTDEADTDSGTWVDQADAQITGCKVQGVCAGTKASCSGGQWHCAYPAAAQGYEEGIEYRCDGVDNNCDGLTDEGLETMALAELAVVKANNPSHPVSSLNCLYETNLVGVCAGLRVATCKNAGTPTAAWDCPYDSLTGYEPYHQESLCDGQDNDCDGQTDVIAVAVSPDQAGCPTAQGLCATVAKPWTVLCQDAHWVCTANLPPGSAYSPDEICDNLDNNCNGATDEGLFFTAGNEQVYFYCPQALNGVCANATVAACDSLNATWKCTMTSPAYEPAVEVHCDGLDNDCDGLTDEDFGTKATAAAKAANCPGFGQCGGHAVASLTCTAGKPVCTYTGVTAYEPKETLCDGLDNDCDGYVDSQDSDLKNLAPADVAKLCPGMGVCKGKPATYTCTNGVATCSYTGVVGYEQGAETSCDGLDNDCDGLTDEDIVRPDTENDCVNAGGVCLHGARMRCTPGQGWLCDYGQVVGYEEYESSCDNLDNDCDGLTDEALQGTRDPVEVCLTAGVCATSNVVVDCTGGQWTCDYGSVPYVPVEEGSGLCEGMDNDCDGLTDEQACSGGPGTLCSSDAECQNATGGSNPAARCRTNIAGTARFCAASGTLCVFSENDQWAEQIASGVTKCADDHTMRTCQSGIWGSDQACLFDTPYCTGLNGASLCSACIPDKPVCIAEDSRGHCSADGNQKIVDLPCNAGDTCVGDGRCVSTAESVLNVFTAGLQEKPDVAWSPGSGFAVVWASKGQDNSDYGVYGRRVSNDGRVLGQEFRVNQQTTNAQTEPAIAMLPDGGFVVVWRSAHTGVPLVYRRAFDKTGAPTDDDDVLVPSTALDKVHGAPDVAVNAVGDALVVFHTTGYECATCKEGIGARAYSGWDAGSEFTVNTFTLGVQRNAAVAALPDNSFVVVWESEGQDTADSYGIFGRIVRDGAPVGGEFPVNDLVAGNQDKAAVVARPDGRFAVAWNAAVAVSGGTEYTVRMRVFENDGTPVDGITDGTVSGDAVDAYLGGLTAFSDDAVMAAYHAGDGDANGVFGAWYTALLDSDGTFPITLVPAGDQRDPSVAATSALSFPYYLAVWVGDDVGGTGTDIRMRLSPR